MDKSGIQLKGIAASRDRIAMLLNSRRARSMRAMAEADAQKQKHQHQVNQIELEMQRHALAELQHARAQVEDWLGRYADHYHCAPVAYLTIGGDGVVCEANAIACAVMDTTGERLIGAHFSSFVASECQSDFKDFFARLLTEPGEHSCEIALNHKRPRSTFIRIDANTDEQMQICRMVVQDITERREQEGKLSFASKIVHSVDDAVLVTGPDNRIVMVNPAFTRVTGYSIDDVIGKSPAMLEANRDAGQFEDCIWSAHASEDNWQCEIECRRKNGESFAEWLSVKAMRDENGTITHRVGIFNDISERKAAEERIQHDAYYDALTNLANRSLVTNRVEHALARANREGVRVALIFADLDNFKPVNDQFGHRAGDSVLKEVALRLRTCARESDTVGRFGGDEFVILLPTIDRSDDAMLVAANIHSALRTEIDVDGRKIHISASVGVAMYPEHGSDFNSLIHAADQAMYCAKRCGGSQSSICCSNPSMSGAAIILDECWV